MKKKNAENNNISYNLEFLDNKINSLIESLIPAIIILVPVIFILYILNIHGYFLPKEVILFRLNNFYKYLMYILGGIYIYKVIRKRVVVTKTDIFLFIFMFFTILSTIFAHNQEIALYGYPNRYEGMYTLLFYCFLYLDCKLLSKDVDVKYLVKMILIVSVLHFLLVILQLTGLYQSIIYMYSSGDAIGLTENCNFLGSLMCLFSMISVGGYLLYNKKDNNIYFLIIFLISYATLLLANSSGPFLSFIVVYIIFIITLLIKKSFNIKKFIITLLVVVILYPVCLYKRDEITPEIKSNFSTIYQLISSKDSADKESDSDKDDNDKTENKKLLYGLGHGRFRIWNNVWKLIKEKPILGYGPDNLGLVYEKSIYDTKIADKAHNIYLHIFVSSGIFAVLSYILWIIYTIYLGLKSRNNTIIILCFGILSYSIQGLFNINVLEVTPYFYLVMGFMMCLINEKKLSFNKK